MISTLMRRFILLPMSFLLALLWGALKQGGVNLSSGTGFGVILIMVTFCVMMFEFVKSGNITQYMFVVDMICSVLAVVTFIAFFTATIFTGKFSLTLVDVLIAGVIVVGDAILCPCNCFRMALRNVMGQIPIASAHIAPVVSQPQPTHGG